MKLENSLKYLRLYVVATDFPRLLLNFSPFPCRAVAQKYLYHAIRFADFHPFGLSPSPLPDPATEPRRTRQARARVPSEADSPSPRARGRWRRFLENFSSPASSGTERGRNGGYFSSVVPIKIKNVLLNCAMCLFVN